MEEPIDIAKKKKSEIRVMIDNFVALVFLQGAHYLLPLITVPYLVRVLQPDLFGLVSGAQYLIQYFITLVDYGFHFSATRLVSIHRDNKARLNSIISAVFFIRILLLLLALVIMIVLILVSRHYSDEAWVYLLTFGMVIGNVFFPMWFFMGMEKMKIVTIAQVVSKIIFACGIFIFVKGRDDYYLVPVFQSAGNIVAGLISLIVMFKLFPVKFQKPEKSEVVLQLKEGWTLFTSTIATTIYVNGNGLMLDLFADKTFVGYYAAGEKLIRAVASLFIPVSTAVYPFISRKFHHDKREGLHYFFRILFLIAIVSFGVSTITFFFGSTIGAFLLGEQYAMSAEVIKILAFVPFVGSIGAFFTYQLYVHVGWKNVLPYILFSACIVNVLLNLMWDKDYKHIGASYALLITEILVPVLLGGYYLLNRKTIR